MSDLNELKKEADDLGIQYHKTIGANKLQEKIEEHYAAQETGQDSIQEAVKQKEAEEAAKAKDKPAAPKTDGKLSAKDAKRVAREKAARETKIVSIIDNDQRVNNQTTTCSVSCANEFFDLGTRILPLNEKIEVSVGHLNTLREIKIPLHVRDQKTGLSSVRMRPRYTINEETV
ncbi:hypothetical protein AD45P2_00040 [Alteromonas phage vB_AmaP_AD45-P2]|uniref:Uncharacterized protein n=2 Tax=Pseudomonadota TaxID=1224 RepID=A0A922T8U5_9HYPH|nr:hypothetical protein [Pseudorhizobium pelagicum]YP_008125979.1 hypothetical protein M610_gp008 [Alteromonas phage vB_AmaP_AD45-P1]AGM46946.1 hypothetical protein AD45P3_00040 [Alteromonas phage vB_AmaP_AD45-P3]AGM47063.1 hypothetical protein AD45P4_00040 [Alteromonas phage vB_AmaP_AD45-P4]AGM47179.1 hypothetical protein AD45P2_00040 [Alteromonas phage vB_AmaP_AD45-P2]AGM46826.1 hypothetical protein AD45P1_00040 [Alteromonas phage vB_AmaP_AD45-P1]KEQ05582.1 hypothetical protein GV68_08610 [